MVVVEFIVCPILAVPAILGGEYFDKLLEEIRPKRKLVESYDGITLPVVRRPSKIVPIEPPLPPPLE